VHGTGDRGPNPAAEIALQLIGRQVGVLGAGGAAASAAASSLAATTAATAAAAAATVTTTRTTTATSTGTAPAATAHPLPTRALAPATATTR
jgi:hypothetical protein